MTFASTKIRIVALILAAAFMAAVMTAAFAPAVDVVKSAFGVEQADAAKKKRQT